jgi:predicted HAD superfamily Cof-like phosphohydrolase
MFRLRFLAEELHELGAALGVNVSTTCTYYRDHSTLTDSARSLALQDALDALIDLTYVSHGTLLQLGLGPAYDEAWRRVHAANLKKQAGKKATRGFIKDAVKPAGWAPPDLSDLVATR